MSATEHRRSESSPPKRRGDGLKFNCGVEGAPKSRSGSRKRIAADVGAPRAADAHEPAARSGSSGGGGCSSDEGLGLTAAAAGGAECDGAQSEKCQFCGTSDSDELLYGQLLTGHGLTVHYFCMLFSSALSQGGSEEDGIFGFLPEDILKEIRRGKKLKCCYCRRTGATIGCVTKKCRKAFHFGCGKTNGALNQYFGTYSTYCCEHRPQQSAPAATSDRLSFHGLGMVTCPICTNSVETRASNATLRSPCCTAAGNTWYHRDCIQQMALNSGMHFIRCPLCNDRDRFISEMLEFGIYIPDRDASWEVEAGAYSELHTSHDRCDVQPGCCCPHGRDHKGGEGSPWEIFLCMSCGGNGIHLACYANGAASERPAMAAVGYGYSLKREDSPPDVTWNCADCSAIMLKSGLQCDRALRSMRNRQSLRPSDAGDNRAGTAAAAAGVADNARAGGARPARNAGRLRTDDGASESFAAAAQQQRRRQDSSIALARHVATSLSLEPPRVVVADVSKHCLASSRGRRGGSGSAGGQVALRR